jgi:hypothetical protein
MEGNLEKKTKNINLNLHVLGSKISLIEQDTLVSSLEILAQRTLVLVYILEELLVGMICRLDVIDRNDEQIILVYSSFGIRQITLQKIKLYNFE